MVYMGVRVVIMVIMLTMQYRPHTLITLNVYKYIIQGIYTESWLTQYLQLAFRPMTMTPYLALGVWDSRRDTRSTIYIPDCRYNMLKTGILDNSHCNKSRSDAQTNDNDNR